MDNEQQTPETPEISQEMKEKVIDAALEAVTLIKTRIIDIFGDGDEEVVALTKDVMDGLLNILNVIVTECFGSFVDAIEKFSEEERDGLYHSLVIKLFTTAIPTREHLKDKTIN